MRLYEFSRKYGVSNKELISILQEAGYEVKGHLAVLDDEAIAFLSQRFSKKKEAESKKGSSVASKGKQKAPIKKEAAKPARSRERREEKKAEKAPAKVAAVEEREMTVAEFAEQSLQPVNSVIMALLKRGIAATKNQAISADTVRSLVAEFEVPLIEKKIEEKKSPKASFELEKEGEVAERMPVVVVIGHVDHGKTTLLDYIRKTRVAAREKGGITQHLGAYQAHTEHGDIVFIDTPGHEAFSVMREHGAAIADIAILVVAADDGVMPQTKEAIKHAHAAELPIIVAINKIDKVDERQKEKVYQDLAQHGLVPEQWGGQVSCVPISALHGDGIDELLEVVSLQSQIMELHANLSVPARGYVLEAYLEKGRGATALLILKHGILRVGDHFVCGDLPGRVTSLRDFLGNLVEEIKPAQPARVTGFPELPKIGSVFQVGDARAIRRGEVVAREHVIKKGAEEGALTIIIKADGVSSRDSLVDAISKLSSKLYRPIHIVRAEVGPIVENDIMLARDTESYIYGLHTRVESNAALIAHKMNIHVRLFNIIYRLLEDLEERVEAERPIKKVSKKVGEAVVLKVFDIKNLGTIAGGRVTHGYIAKNGSLVVWRGKNRIGEGSIASLQQEKKSVKEVKKGFECGVMIDGYTDWQVDDRFECYVEVSE